MSLPFQSISFEVLIWILVCVSVSIGAGVIIGRGFALRNLTVKLRKEREKMLCALQTLAQSTQQLTSDVDHHNEELASVERRRGRHSDDQRL